MDNAELLKTFEDLAASQTKMANDILRMAGPNITEELSNTVDYLRQQAVICSQHAQAIRDGALD